MISWATKADPVADITDTDLSSCKVCSASGHARYLVEQNYFLLYGLPLFRTQRVIFRICSSCSFKSRLRRGNSAVLDDHAGNKIAEINTAYPPKMKFKYFWGAFVLALLAGMIGWFLISFAGK
ncbi:MAG: hypothetical protein ACO1O6_10645 [Bacteroidota bacterium]